MPCKIYSPNPMLIERLTDVEKSLSCTAKHTDRSEVKQPSGLRHNIRLLPSCSGCSSTRTASVLRAQSRPTVSSVRAFQQVQTASRKPATRKLTLSAKSSPAKTIKGRVPLPDHLPVEQIKIHPEGDLSGTVCNGTEVTDELEIRPARLAYIKR